MSVRKRFKSDGSFVWEFCITISKHPRKQYRKSGFKTKQLALEAEQEAIQKYKNKNITLNQNKTTFKDILTLFFEHIVITSKSIYFICYDDKVVKKITIILKTF